MRRKGRAAQRKLWAGIVAWVAFSPFASACGEQRGRLDPGSGGGSGTDATGASGHQGHGTSGALTNAGTGGAASNAAGQNAGGMAGADASGGGGSGEAGASSGGAPPLFEPQPVCVYHTPAPLSAVNPSATSGAPLAMGGAAGAGSSAPESAGAAGSEQGGGGAGGESGGGGGGARPTITIQKSGFANAYLADANGRALYVFGADLPGDCAHDPVTTCYKDCPLSWPVFDAGARLVADGLDDALFGTIERTDGLRQTTYRGWPLYYYKNDSQPGDVRGQAVGRIWHVAEVTLPNVIVARVGTERFLADEFGRALYTYEGDTKGADGAPPRSACIGSCRENFAPFARPYLAPVSYLEKSAFAIFVRDDGAIQQSYKGWPLYRSRADERAGDRNGASSPGWIVAAP